MDRAKNKSSNRKLNDSLIFASFDGLNILELMKKDLATFNAVHEQIEKIDSEADEVV